MLVEPEDPEEMAAAIEQMLEDEALAAASSARGLTRARDFDWSKTAHGVYDAYHRAIEHRQCGSE
jgi:glycosyltransferase involved in cell wall biosynthesis